MTTPARTTPTRAHHPHTCRTCTGTGWEPGPPIQSQANGDPITYTTVQPCTDMAWYNRNHGWDPHYDEPLPPSNPAARAALLAGYLQGTTELDETHRHHPPTTPDLEAGIIQPNRPQFF